MWSPDQNQRWLRQLIGAHRSLRRNATVYVGHDTHWAPDMRTLPLLAQTYNGSVSRVFFDEDAGKDGVRGEAPSYRDAYVHRPGRWGVFHVARFELDARTPLPPRQPWPELRCDWRTGYCDPLPPPRPSRAADSSERTDKPSGRAAKHESKRQWRELRSGASKGKRGGRGGGARARRT